MSQLKNYTDLDRHYHNLTHISHMLEGLRKHFPGYDGTLLRSAILYHDVIYVPGSPDNERASAEVAISELRDKFTDFGLNEIYRLIMLTKDHTTYKVADGPGHVIIDLDLAGLAGNNYLKNSVAIRQEFWMVPDEQWREGRKAWLKSFLSRKSIYLTRYGKENWEEPARFNMESELDYLELQ